MAGVSDWAYLENVKDDRHWLYFPLPQSRLLLIPKSAFATTAEAEKFLALARARWEIAKVNQRYAASSADEGVWPPAPRIQA